MVSFLRRIFGEFKSITPEKTLQTLDPEAVNPTGLLEPGLIQIRDLLLERHLPVVMQDHQLQLGHVKLEAFVAQDDVTQFLLRLSAPVPAPYKDIHPQPTYAAARLNLLAGLGAFTVRNETLYLTAQLCIRMMNMDEFDHRWEQLYIPMMAEVMEEAYTWKALQKALTTKTPPEFEPALTMEAWDAELDTLPALLGLERHEFTASCTIPVHYGLGNEITRDSALLQLNAQDPHPGFGPGLRVVLTLPNVYKSDEIAIQLANRLNQCETEHTRLSPFGGAWTKHPTKPMICFVSYWPAHWLTIKTWSHRVVLWAQTRSQWGYEWLMTV